MDSVKFTDFRIEVENAMDSLAVKALNEVSGVLKRQIEKNTPTGKVNGGQLRGSWEHRIAKESDGHKATIGSPLERALWIEFGTGEHALPEAGKPGRKGGWYIPVGEGQGMISERVAKAYGMTIRKGRDGMKWVFTLGMKPQRPAHKAYTSLKNKMIKRIQEIFKGGLSS